jgi:hypothetical protein
MAGLVPAIHVFCFPPRSFKDVDARDKPGHDELATSSVFKRSGNRFASNQESGACFDSIETGSSSVAATTPLRYASIRTDAGNAP